MKLSENTGSGSRIMSLNSRDASTLQWGAMQSELCYAGTCFVLILLLLLIPVPVLTIYIINITRCSFV